MIADRDIWAAANEVIKWQSDPLWYAAQRQVELSAAGDAKGCSVWQQIETAIRALLDCEPRRAVH